MNIKSESDFKVNIENLKTLLFDVNDKCPICKGKIKQKTEFLIGATNSTDFCENACLRIFKHYRLTVLGGISKVEDFYIVCVFDEKKVMIYHDREIEQKTKEIQERINYWKENDRYIVKLLAK